MTHLTSLYLNDNSIARLPPDISKLSCLTHLDISSNKLRSLPQEVGDLLRLRELLANNNYLRVLPYELGKLYKLQHLGRCTRLLSLQFNHNRLRRFEGSRSFWRSVAVRAPVKPANGLADRSAVQRSQLFFSLTENRVQRNC